MNKFLRKKERGDTILFSELLKEIPPDSVLLELFPDTCRPAHQLVKSSGLEVLSLRMKGLTQAEIAEQLGLTPGQVAYRSSEVSNALHMNVPPYICVDIPALGRLLSVPCTELTGYKLLSELLQDMPSDEELARLFIERGSIKGGKKELSPTNRDLQLLKMRSQKQSYSSIGKAMGMEAKEVSHRISLTLLRIRRDLQIKLDVPELHQSQRHSPPSVQADDAEAEERKRLSVLTERQREVWSLHAQGKSKSQIAKELNISYTVVSEHLRYAERRLREYEHYCAEEARNKEPVSLPLTRGEVKIIIEALSAYERELESDNVRHKVNDWIGKLPYKSKIVADLYDKAQEVIYGKPLTRLPPNWYKDEK